LNIAKFYPAIAVIISMAAAVKLNNNIIIPLSYWIWISPLL